MSMPHSNPSVNPSGIPIMMTAAMRQRLVAMGYTLEQIGAMPLSEAHAILNGQPNGATGHTNGATAPSADDILEQINAMLEDAKVEPTDVLTARKIAELLPIMADYTGDAWEAAKGAMRELVGKLPADERAALELPLLKHWFKAKADLDSFMASCPPPPGAPIFKGETLEQLFQRPPKEWLISQVLGAGDTAMIYGPPGSGKTFVTVDLIFAACLGQQWAMRFDVARPLRVAYCAGEGVSGLADRFRAAAHHYNVTEYLPGFTFFDLVPQLYQTGPDAMTQFVTDWKAKGETLDLLVIDTLHSATVGADENSAQDMGQVLGAAKFASRELGCAVLLNHHSNKAGTGERGSSAMRGAMDCMIQTSGSDGRFTLSCEKLKDGEAWKPQTFSLVAVGELDSVRVWWDEPHDGAGDGRKSNTGREILELLASVEGALTAKKISEALAALPQSVNKVLARLVKDGLTERGEDTRRTFCYTITQAGKDALQEGGAII